jgi:cysteine desulfurase/selenocysteine lyase
MTLDAILRDEALRQHEFPVCRERAFFAHAAVCPLPRRVADAVSEYAQAATLDDQERPVLATVARETRALAAQLIGAQADEIALVAPTSMGLSFVAGGFPFRRNDNIVIYFDDYPANVYPWLALAEQGVEVRFVETEELGRIQTDDVLNLVDENTRLVALASCHFVSGWRLDLAEISRELRARKIAFCVDGIQTLGAFPTLAEHADFIAADAHKWLLGPCGSGFLYVSRRWHEALRPIVYGWNNVHCPDFVARETMKLRTGAHRYEAGSHSMLGLVGLRAALQLILEVGVENISAELLRKRAWLVSAFQNKGWQVLSSDAPAANQSGIVTLHRSDLDIPALHQRLTEQGIVTSLRADRAGRKYLRLSPHFYTSDAELERLAQSCP